MPAPDIDIRPIGQERQPLATIDGFAADPDALRTAAIAARFEPAGEHYPGIRAALPEGWLRAQMPLISTAITRAFGRHRRLHVIDASFSIVTTPPAELTVRQRLPHVDAFGAERIAFLLYLTPAGGDGTAFYRHRSTRYETVDEGRAPAYFAALEAEIAKNEPPAAYIAGDTALFERTATAEANYNRALLYRSYVLHSGAIGAEAALPSDPREGRLMVTGFLAVE